MIESPVICAVVSPPVKRTSEIILSQNHIARFWEKVIKTDSCWKWTGCRTKLGYGQTRCTGGHRKSHRVSYTIAHGPIPDGMEILHKCDNPSCVNPDHLETGSHAMNMGQMKARGRAATGDRHGMRLYPERVKRGAANHRYGKPGRNLRPLPGEKHGNAKFTDAQVVLIRSAYTGKHGQQSELAREYGVKQSAIWSIVKGKTWTHLLPHPE